MESGLYYQADQTTLGNRANQKLSLHVLIYSMDVIYGGLHAINSMESIGTYYNLCAPTNDVDTIENFHLVQLTHPPSIPVMSRHGTCCRILISC